MLPDMYRFLKHIQMQQSYKVTHLHPHYTTFRYFRDETNTFQNICNVIDSSSLFVYSQDLDSLHG